jgi:hypothetical protein
VTRFARRLSITTVVICCAGTSEIQSADAGPPPNLGLGSFRSEIGLRYFSIDKVRKDLQLTDEQIGGIAKLQKASVEDLKKDQASFKDARAATFEDLRKKMNSLREIRQNRIEQRLRIILNEKQIERVGQLALQLSGARTLASKAVADALNLTDEQRNKLREMKETALQESIDFQHAHPNLSVQETANRIGEFRQRSEKQIMEILSPEQQKQFDELKGQRLELTPGELRGAVGDLDGAIPFPASGASKGHVAPTESSDTQKPGHK